MSDPIIDQRAQLAHGSAPTLKWHGAHITGVTYLRGAVVKTAVGTFVAIADRTAIAPPGTATDSAIWQFLGA